MAHLSDEAIAAIARKRQLHGLACSGRAADLWAIFQMRGSLWGGGWMPNNDPPTLSPRPPLLIHRYIALLRAVNVGGTGRLPMAELKAMCEVAGFLDVRT